MGSRFRVALRPRHSSMTFDVAQQLHRLIVADVVQAKWRNCSTKGSGLLLFQPGSGCATRSEIRTTPLGNVVHKSKVTLVVPVVENIDGLALENISREQEKRHIRPPPRTIHREESQSCRGDFESHE